jgi:CMP-N,N'-diacetyllegionaminic acid synthase
MFVLGTICCRAGSKGVKNKNIKPLCGKPLVTYTLETAQQCSVFNDILVSTDSAEIISIAAEFNIQYIINRPVHLAADDTSKWDVFIQLLEQYEKDKNIRVDYIADMDATAPLKAKEDIEAAVHMAIAHPDADVVITAYEAESNPYFNMMEINNAGFATMVKSPGDALVCRQHAPAVYSLSPSAFVIKRDALYQYPHWSKANCMLSIMPRNRAVDIDTEMDFAFVDFLMQQKG